MSFPLHHDTLTPVLAVIADETPQSAFGRYVVTYSSMSAVAWLYWDMCLTFEQEVEVVWQMRWSFIKCLYYFMRYMGACLIGSTLVVGMPDTPKWNFTSHDCLIWQAYQGAAALLIHLAVEYILLLRVFALYSQNRLVRRVLPVLFITEVVIMLAALIHFIPRIEYDPTCLGISAPVGMYVYGAAWISFQFILFGLTLIKFISAVRSGWNNTPIITLLMRDGTWTFFLVIITITSYALVLALADGSFSALLYNWLISVLSFVGYRNLLNIFQLSRVARVNSETDNSVQLTTNIFTSRHMAYERNDTYEMSALKSTGE